MNINRFRDSESVRQQRNQTDSQKRNIINTKEGVLVNNFIKDYKECPTNLNDTYDTLVISQNAELPVRIYEPDTKKTKNKNNLLPIAATAIGVMATFAGVSAFIRHNAKIVTKLTPQERIPDFTRNLAINDEAHQAIARMVISPNQKTLLAGAGVLVLSAMAFMGKVFSEGFRDVWVKRREADIQKNLQEELIDIETQSFGGKIQITRSMLSDKAKEFSRYLSYEDNSTFPSLGRFRQFRDVSFGTNYEKEKPSSKKNTAGYIALGITGLGAIAGLGFLSLKNLTKSKKLFEEYTNQTKEFIIKLVETASQKDVMKDTAKLAETKASIDGLLQTISASPKYIEETLSKLKWAEADKNNFIASIVAKTKAPAVKASDAIGGSGAVKTSFYSHVDDYRAFCYNYLLNTENRQFKQMFFGITGLTALSYGGKMIGEAVKDIEVKKINAETELDLQNRLVSTELRNFKAKKDAAIQPLVNEFYKQVEKGKPKEELKTMADNILFEVKNGPPFVYS